MQEVARSCKKMQEDARSCKASRFTRICAADAASKPSSNRNAQMEIRHSCTSLPNELLICACMRALDRRPGLFPTRGSGGFTVPPSSGTAAAALAAGKAAAAAISLPSLAAWRSLCTCARRVLGAPPLSLGIGKLQRAFGPRIARAASSYARAASSAESNVPSQL
eukprot:358445-Chlamydomonas_euryale.AAC.6